MPDIIIKGMEMPNECPCDLGYCIGCVQWRDAYAQDIVQDVNTLRHPDCPLHPAPEWTMCKIYKPKDAGHYHVAFSKPQKIDNIYTGYAYWTGGRWVGYLDNEIVAWMPRPEPPKDKTRI